MFERAIGKANVIQVVRFGEVIADYPDDEPFPSLLMLGLVGNRRLHVVVAIDEESKTCYIIIAYDPDPDLWGSDFKTRRNQ